MKGPMKGATIGHAKQRISSGRYIGLTEPGIIAAEPPNAIVNQLVIMPDIEKRLEAFVRLAHGVVIFPGGVGTAEEILYLLGIVLDPRNAEQRLPVILTGPEQSAGYFTQIRQFIEAAVGPQAMDRLSIVVGDPAAVARKLVADIAKVRTFRRASNDSYAFNWLLHVPEDFQHPFEVTHASMRQLALHRDQPQHLLVANLRRLFSGIVSGNVKEQGIALIEKQGPFELSGDPALMRLLDELLRGFVAQGRMKLPGSVYTPCYRIVA
jgi:predicted Rossmann-fold nucleotide-binding protein